MPNYLNFTSLFQIKQLCIFCFTLVNKYNNLITILHFGEKMINVTASIPLTDYVKTKIGPETGRGHKGYLDALLVVASKVTTPEQAKGIQESIDAVASAVKFEKRYSLRGQSGEEYTVERPSMLVDAMLKLQPYLGQGLYVERVVSEIIRDLRQIGK